MRQIEIQNITFNFYKQGIDAVEDDDNLGLAYLTVESPMLRRFRRECGWDGNKIPHYDRIESREAVSTSSHDCYNTDTQIVLMHWLFDKRRKYRLDYQGLDAFWLFHDSLHAQNDVHGAEVNMVNSYVEKQRLIDGAAYACKNGVHIHPKTVAMIAEAWDARWKFWENSRYEKFTGHELLPFVAEHLKADAEFLLDSGESSSIYSW